VVERVELRSDWRPGDLGAVVRLHGELYAREHGFDASFEAYVAEGLARFVLGRGSRERAWIAERGAELLGCVGIVDAGEGVAQLRWFLVAPSARGRGLGRRLLEEALRFAREEGYRTVTLWTVDLLTDAARLYRAAGFRLVESHPRRLWGRDLVEERYEL
jgi:GNAT superfamily N-acetyltransferase